MFLDLITSGLDGLAEGDYGATAPPASVSTSTKVMMSWVNHIDDPATILVASQEVSGSGISNIANPIVGRRWRMIGNTGYGQADFGSDKEIGIIALMFPRDTTFPTSGTIRHLFDPDGGAPGAGVAMDSGTVSIGAVAGYGYHVWIPEAPFEARYWRWTLTAIGVAFIDTGRAWAGEAWQPNVGISLGHAQAWNDLSRVSASPRSGAEFVDRRPRQQQRAFGLDFLDDDGKDTVREIQRIIGVSEQMLVCFNPSLPARETILGRAAETAPILEPGISIFSKAFQIRESL